MPIHVRAAVAQDEQAVVALWRVCHLVVSHNDPAPDFRIARAGACSDVLVGEDEVGRIKGSVMVGHDARGAGLGRQMVTAAEDWLRERGVAKAQLMVRDTNVEVVSFYERLGFEVAPRVVLGKWLGLAS